MRNRTAEIKRRFGGRKGSDKRFLSLRQGTRAEIHASQNGKRAERSDQQLVEIVAGYVFHHAPAAFRLRAFTRYKFHAQTKVAHRAVRMAQRRTRIRGHDSTDSCALRERNRQRKKLLLFAKRAEQICHAHAWLDAERQILWIVGKHMIQSGEIERNVV